MSNVELGMILRPYDQLCPLILGEVETPGLKLSFDLHTPLSVDFRDGIDAAEISFNRYTLGKARGDDLLVGLPAFILRGFRHRNFLVLRDSPLEALSDLKGMRVGTDSWGDTGTLWARAALREAGVEVTDVTWVAGQLDVNAPSKPPQPGDVQLPDCAERLDAGDTLMTALLEKRIDAITTAFVPDVVFEPDGAIRRLVRDYRQAEAAYHQRQGVYPGFHIIAFRRTFAESHPHAVVSLYAALQQSWNTWTAKARKFAESSPWQMAELETVRRDFPDDDPPFGTESKAHKRMIATICHEQWAQNLVTSAADPASLFADFRRIEAMTDR